MIFSIKKPKKEINRQLLHLVLGLVLGFGLIWNIFGTFILFVFFILSLVFSWMLKEGYKVPYFEAIVELTERKEEKDGLRTGGFIAFLLGALLVSIFFSNLIAGVAILILGIGDSLSSLLDKNIKKIKHPFGRRYLEAPFFGAFIGAAIASLYVPFWPVLFAGLVAMFIEGIDSIYTYDFIDDNVVIPIVVSIILYVLL